MSEQPEESVEKNELFKINAVKGKIVTEKDKRSETSAYNRAKNFKWAVKGISAH